MKYGWFGGIRLAERKELAEKELPLTALAPRQVAIPLRQHIGRECSPLVSVGDAVKLGQKIGDGKGMCVPVHASVSGRVTALEKRPHPGGGQSLCVVIQNDFQKTPAKELSFRPEWKKLSKKEILFIIREAGIVGMGGAAFPTEIKANQEEGVIDTVIVNACECEPYITADESLLLGYAAEVLEGLEILSGIFGAKKKILAVEDNKAQAIEHLKRKLSETASLAELCVLSTRYPQGAEKLLIRSVTGRVVPSGALAREVGCAVFNAATCAAVYFAVAKGRPLIQRIVTVTGEGVKTPKNLIVPIGTSVSDAIKAAGGMKEDVTKVICGGPMMGKALQTTKTPLVKGIGALVCLRKKPEDTEETSLCIHCGKCVQVCPMRLQPLYLYRWESQGAKERLRTYHVLDCMECGCCAYICPAKLSLVESIRRGKQAVGKEKDEGEKNEAKGR